MTHHSPSDPLLRRFNGYHGRSSIPIRATWKLRTEKLIDGQWVPIASFPTVPEEHRHDQRERMQRHASAFGGAVRLLRGELLLASWQDGVLEVDLRGEVAA